MSIDRDALIAAIDKLHEEADWHGQVEAEQLARALGWSEPFHSGPYGDWIRARLDEALR